MSSSYTFGRFRVDVPARAITQDGERVQLPARAFDMLVALLCERGHVVDKEVLVKQVWPDVSVGENNLSQCIASLRKALGDHGPEHRFIITVPGRGYSFIAEVEEQAAQPPAVPRKRPTILLAVAATLAIGAVVAWVWRDRPAEIVRIFPLTGSGGSEQMPAFSPDGRSIAYCWRQPNEQEWKLYVKLIGAGNPLCLEDAGPALFPAWSPDGRFVAYYGTPAGIYTIPALGGHRHLLTNVKTADRVAWFADGRRLALVDTDPQTGYRNLYEFSLDTNRRRKLVSGRSGWDIHSPAISPAGDILAYAGSPAGGVNSIFLLLPGETAPRRLTGNDEFPTYQLSWAPGGKEILYCSRNDGMSTLWRKPAGDGQSRRVDAAGYEVAYVAASSQSHKIAVVREVHPANLWLAPIDNPSAATELASTPGRQTAPEFSPDGRMLAFESNRSGASEVWRSDLSGHNLLQVTSIGAERRTLAGTPRWSPDGSEIVFDARPAGNPDIYIVKATGGPVRRITDSMAEDVVPSFSRDGRWIYFASNRSGVFEVWKAPAEGGEAVQVTRRGGFAPVESIDSRHLYFTQHQRIPGPGTLWRMPSEGGEPVRVLPGEVRMHRWALTGSIVVHLTEDSKLMVTNPDSGTTRLAGVMPARALSITVSPDGRSLVFSRESERSGNIFVLEGFR